MKRLAAMLLAIGLVIACGASARAESRLALSSPAFGASGDMPAEYTCEGANVSPELRWAGAPAATKAFALIVDDPDAPDPARPQRTWVHWVVPSIAANTTSLAKGATPSTAGKNDWGKTEWGGPCPPIGRHRYFFKLYALDADIGKPGMTKAELVAAIQGHQLGYAELVGTYQKKKQ